MSRLTLEEVQRNNSHREEFRHLFDFVKQEQKELIEYKKIEEELGIDLITLFKAIENGIYYIKDNEIQFCRWCIRVGDSLVEVKPCYAVKETTLQSTYYGDVEKIKPVEDAHYWSWKTCVSVKIKDYGKTWALDKKDLTKEVVE